jgi:hypothetical protein
MKRDPVKDAMAFAYERITMALCAFIGLLLLLAGISGLIGMAAGKIPAWTTPRLLLAVVVGLVFILPMALTVIFGRQNLN